VATQVSFIDIMPGICVVSHSHVIADAAVATSAALNVTEPSCCGIGG
jgi:gamma-glutamyltranspeptidase